MQRAKKMRESLGPIGQAFRDGRLDRRSFLAICGLAGLTLPAIAGGKAHAAAGELVMWNWGGQAEVCYDTAIGPGLKRVTGLALKSDTSGPLQGKIKEMVNSGAVTADVCDAELFDAYALGGKYLEPIDYSIVSKEKTLPQFAAEFGAPVFLYGHSFMYDTTVYKNAPPKNWADFFDTSKFPGKRSLHKWAIGSLEAALMADGVSKDALYPLDMKRAIAKIKSIKADSIYWGTISEGHDMIVNHEVPMAMIWHNRSRKIEQETGGRFKTVINQTLALPVAYIVPKGNPAGRKAAMQFIAVTQSPDIQAAIFSCIGLTPGNPEAVAKLSAEDAIYSLTSEQNKGLIAYGDPVWWGKNTDMAIGAFLDAIS